MGGLQGDTKETQEDQNGLEEVNILGDFGDEGQQLIDNGHVNAQLL